jgi:hypothetical protein
MIHYYTVAELSNHYQRGIEMKSIFYKEVNLFGDLVPTSHNLKVAMENTPHMPNEVALSQMSNTFMYTMHSKFKAHEHIDIDHYIEKRSEVTQKTTLSIYELTSVDNMAIILWNELNNYFERKNLISPNEPYITDNLIDYFVNDYMGVLPNTKNVEEKDNMSAYLHDIVECYVPDHYKGRSWFNVHAIYRFLISSKHKDLLSGKGV